MSTSEGEQTTQACATGAPTVLPLPPKMRPVSSGPAPVRAAGQRALHQKRAQGRPTGQFSPVGCRSSFHEFLHTADSNLQFIPLSQPHHWSVRVFRKKEEGSSFGWVFTAAHARHACSAAAGVTSTADARCIWGATFSPVCPAASRCPARPRAADSDPRAGWRRFTQARVRPVCDDIRRFFGWAGDRRSRTLPNTSRTFTRYGSCTRPFAHHSMCWRDPIERVSGR